MFDFETGRMIEILNNITIVPLEMLPEAACYYSHKEYVSPNGEYKACVIPVKNPKTGKDESEIILKTKNGETLLKKNASEDLEDSFFVAKARWTPDSRFFVYSLFNSCGHYKGCCPTFFISTDKVVRRASTKYFVFNRSEACDYPLRNYPDFRISSYDLKPRSLDHCIGTVVNPEFRVCAPDIIKTVAISKTIKDRYYFEVSLRDMMEWY